MYMIVVVFALCFKVKELYSGSPCIVSYQDNFSCLTSSLVLISNATSFYIPNLSAVLQVQFHSH